MGKKQEVVIAQEKTIVMSEAQFRTILENATAKAMNTTYQTAERKAKKEQERRDRQSFSAYKETERRLRGYPVIKERIAKMEEELEDLIEHPFLPGRSKDICLYQTAPSMLGEDEIIEQRKISLQGKIYADQMELQTIDSGLKLVADYPYFKALPGRYFENKSTYQLAEELDCDSSTVYRSLKPMVNKIVVWLYGSESYETSPAEEINKANQNAVMAAEQAQILRKALDIACWHGNFDNGIKNMVAQMQITLFEYFYIQAKDAVAAEKKQVGRK